MDLSRYIREVPDFPVKDVIFKDITPLLANSEAFQETINLIISNYDFSGIDIIAGIESRGFILAAPIAYKMNKPFAIRRLSGVETGCKPKNPFDFAQVAVF